MIRLKSASEADHAQVPAGRGRSLFLWPPAAAGRPAHRARARLHRRDLFDLEAATDPQISPDGRWIAYVRRSGDIMTDRFRRSIWLIDTATGRQCRSRPGAQPAALVARRRPARLYRRRRGRARAIVRALDGDRPGGARSPACPTRRRASPGRRTAARSPMRCSCPTKARGSARRSRGPRARNGREPLQVITAVTYRADGEGYLRAGYDQLFLVSGGGRRAAPVELRAL